MKILLVNNIASFNSTLAKSMNQIDGVEAKYLVTVHHKYIESNQFEVFIPTAVSKRKPLNYLKHKLTYKKRIKQLIQWCDVVYYLWNSVLGEQDLKWAYSLNKPIFIEWVGSDIRDPSKLMKINPHFDSIFNNGYEYKTLESLDFKNEVQTKFSKYNAKVFACPEMKLYINQTLFPTIYPILQRIDLKKFEVYYPIQTKVKPKIVHSPSAPIAKGTTVILPIIEKLKANFDFDFVLLTGMKREEVLLEIQTADIFLDQIVCGGYGMASCEAMAFGKPVVCYLLPELFDLGLPISCPIVNANADNLEEHLKELLLDGNLRHDIGKQSRAFVEQYHNGAEIAKDLIKVFKQQLN